MQVSVVIVNYNVRYFLELCLKSVQAALRNIDGEIIVVDNNSSDESVDFLRNKFPEVKLITNQENKGFSKANNQGVAIAKGTYILILNPDTVLPEDSLEKLLYYTRNKDKLGMITAKLIDGSGQFLPESKRSLPTPKVALKKMFGISNAKNGKYYATHLDENTSGAIEILVGAFMFLKRELYQEVGGFDNDYFMYGEDIDLSYKIIKKGYQNYYYPSVQVIHFKGESTKKNSKYLRNFYGAMRIFYRKHFKLNPLFDWMTLAGIQAWKILHFFRLKKYTSTTKISKNILYVGSDNEVFEKLQNLYRKAQVHVFAVCETRVISRYDDAQKINEICKEKNIDEIVFDGASHSFSKIIFFMVSLQDLGLRYMMHPEDTNYIIGSHDKESKGTVLDLTGL